jgi:hypothetical protein
MSLKNTVRESGLRQQCETVSCPFCSDTGFDLIGLKIHLTSGYCDTFNDTPLQDPPWKKGDK